MNNATLGTYGAPYTNKQAVEDPTSEADADLYNQMAEDVAQMTRTASRASFRFGTVASGSATVDSASTVTVWGTGGTHNPTVVRTTTGTYTATFPTTKLNGLGNTETVSFLRGWGQTASGTVFGHVQVTVSGAVATIYTFGTGHTLADLTAGTSLDIFLR